MTAICPWRRGARGSIMARPSRSSLPVRAFLVPLLLLAAVPALADDLSEEAPEPPMPQAPKEMPVASDGPAVLGPDPRELLVEQCKDENFVACFKKWRPPPPPPEPEKPEPATKEAKATEPPPPPSPPDPNAPRDPAAGGPLTGPPPAPNPQADKATYDALVKAMKDAGLEGKVPFPSPPQDGSSTMELAPAKPVPAKSSQKTTHDPKQKAPARP